MPAYQTVISHAHLKVRDLEKSVAFYTRYFNLTVIEKVANYAFLSGGNTHHEIALQALGDRAPASLPYGVGLYHIAFETPDKKAFALAYKTLRNDGIAFQGVDHRISWALYFNDPDDNGLEIFVDTRHDTDGEILWHGMNLPLSEAQVLATLDSA